MEENQTLVNDRQRLAWKKFFLNHMMLQSFTAFISPVYFIIHLAFDQLNALKTLSREFLAVSISFILVSFVSGIISNTYFVSKNRNCGIYKYFQLRPKLHLIFIIFCYLIQLIWISLAITNLALLPAEHENNTILQDNIREHRLAIQDLQQAILDYLNIVIGFTSGLVILITLIKICYLAYFAIGCWVYRRYGRRFYGMASFFN